MDINFPLIALSFLLFTWFGYYYTIATVSQSLFQVFSPKAKNAENWPVLLSGRTFAIFWDTDMEPWQDEAQKTKFSWYERNLLISQTTFEKLKVWKSAPTYRRKKQDGLPCQSRFPWLNKTVTCPCSVKSKQCSLPATTSVTLCLGPNGPQSVRGEGKT